MEVLRVEHLGVQYGQLRALDDLNVSVDAGQIVGIIGPNGAGKSSAFAGITNSCAHSGDVFLAGENVTSFPTYELTRRGLRRTFQLNSFFHGLSVLENVVAVRSGMKGVGVPTSIFRPRREAKVRRELRDESSALLERFGISIEYHDQMPGDLPYGHQRSLSLILAAATQPAALLIDEPAAGSSGQEMMDLVRILLAMKDEGKAILLIEHHMDFVMELADEILVIDRGVTIAHGTPAEVQRDPSVLKAYLGASA